MQPSRTTAPNNPATGSAEEVSIRQLLAHGKSKTALDRAKDLHKSLGSAASEALLLDAYAARIQALLDQNLMLEAKSLLDLVRGRYPSAKSRLDALSATSSARSGALDELLAPLADADLAADRRAAIEQAVQKQIADLAALAACPALPADHSLRVAAAALDRAFAAATSGLVTDEQIALPEVSHRSPLGSWKLLVRAIAHFYRGEDDACLECLGMIKPESVPARLVPAMHSMLGVKPAVSLTPLDAALISRTTESPAALRSELEKLDRAFSEQAGEAQIFKLMRSAMQEARKVAPNQVETLKRLIWVRGAGDGMDPERMISSLQGMARQDATFFRALAHRMETMGGSKALSMACEFWDDFRQHAVREGWFAANGVEAATLYLHMAGLLRRVPDEDLEEFQEESRSHRFRGVEDSYYLFPGKLYERSCVLDPHPEAFSQWLKRAESEHQGEDVAKAWHKIRPMDIDPLLYLMQEAERRNAFPSALTYLDKAERIDAVHSVVRAARLRLLAGSALRHLQKKKPHLAAEKLQAMADLPQSKQGDRPAFLAALGYVIGLHRNDDAATDEARAEAARLLGSDIAAGMLALGIADAAKGGHIVNLPLVKELSKAERSDLPASIGRVVAIGKDFGITKFRLTWEYMDEAVKQFPRVADSLDTTQLRTLAEAALGGARSEFAYAVSGEGLRRGGPTEARFLMLRARSLPEWAGERHAVCAAAAAELARPHQDTETVGMAVDLVRAVFGPDSFSLTRDQAAGVLRKEIAATAYPTVNSPGPDYSALLPDEPCNCPDCRRKRGELPGAIDDDDDDEEEEVVNVEEMERIFNDRVPPDLSPDVAKMLFEVMKTAYLNGIPPDELIEELEKLEKADRSGGSPGKRKKGKRK